MFYLTLILFRATTNWATARWTTARWATARVAPTGATVHQYCSEDMEKLTVAIDFTYLTFR